MNNRIKITCAFLALSFSIMAQDIDYKPFSEWSHKTEGTSQYYFYTPSNIPSGKKIPLAIFLHGCCGTDNIARPRNAVDPGARVWHNFGDNYQSEPMYIVAGATSSGWTQHFPNLKKVIDDLISAGKVDPQRVYITGFSMGGRGTWDFINAYPNYFAAAIPMGMAPAGDFVNRYNMPIFINTADNDSYAPVSTVMNNVSSIRNKYGYDKGGETWQTGVNPKWHVYPGGHGVEQWMSTQSEGITLFNNTRWTFDTDNGYLDWALSKINDGNVYPSVWFESPSYMQKFENAGKIQIQIKAVDIDGSIEKVELFKNNVLIATINQLSNGFYNAELEILDGDTKISAKAYDNKGKTAISEIYTRVNNMPVFTTLTLPNGQAGQYYCTKIFAEGNQPTQFNISSLGNTLPKGLYLEKNGLLHGVPQASGNFSIRINVADYENDSVNKLFTLEINAKNTNDVIISNAKNYKNEELRVMMIQNGEVPFLNNGTEINFSGSGIYNGYKFIQTYSSDQNNNTDNCISFNVDAPVTVYIAYPVRDNLFTSTIPSWLSGYTKENNGQITAQYFYYNVYTKDFPAGNIVVPGANAAINLVNTNYFVMVKKQSASINTTPEINTTSLPDGYLGIEYKQLISVINGDGKIMYSLAGGTLPKGIFLRKDGILYGTPEEAGSFSFNVNVKDFNGDESSKQISLNIQSFKKKEFFATLRDTVYIANGNFQNLNIKLSNLAQGKTYQVLTSSFPDTMLLRSNIIKNNDSIFLLPLKEIPAKIRMTSKVMIKIRENGVTDTINDIIKYASVKFIPYINAAPSFDDIADYTTGLNYSAIKQSIVISNLSDGNNQSESLSFNVVSDNPSILRTLKTTYVQGEKTASISFFPNAVGTANLTVTIKDDAGIDLNGKDSYQQTFKVTVLSQFNSLYNVKSGSTIFYPNPTVNILHSDMPLQLVALFGINGHKLKEFTNTQEINISDLAAGSYILRYIDETGKNGEQLIVKME